jgi:hypothetical protein
MKPILCLEEPGGSAGATLAGLAHPAVSRSLNLSQAEFLGALPAVGLLLLLGDGKIAELASLAWRRAGLRSLVWTNDEALAELLPLQPYLVLLDPAQLGRLTGRVLSPNGGTGTTREMMAAAAGLIETGPLVVAVALGEADLLLASPLGTWRAVLPGVGRTGAPTTARTTDQAGSQTEGLSADLAGRLLAGLARGLLQELPPMEILRQTVAIATGQEAQAVRVAAVGQPAVR